MSVRNWAGVGLSGLDVQFLWYELRTCQSWQLRTRKRYYQITFFVWAYTSMWRHGVEKMSTLLVLCGGNTASIGQMRFSARRANNAELRCCFDVGLNKLFEQTVKFPVIWDVITLMRGHCNVFGLAGGITHIAQYFQYISIQVSILTSWQEKNPYHWYTVSLIIHLMSTWTNCWTNIRYVVIWDTRLSCDCNV